MNDKLASRPVVLITGATGGIGYATALWYINAGYQVIYTSRQAIPDLEFKLVKGADVSPVHIQSELANSAQIKPVFQQIQKMYGRLDCLVHCAGNMHQAPLLMTRELDIDQQYQIHLKTSLLLAQYASRLMTRAKKGAMCFISSVVAHQGAEGQALYASAKAGLHGLVKSLSKELGAQGLRVNAVAPGVIETELVSHFTEAQRAALKEHTALKQLGQPEQVADVIGFINSSSAGYITGQVIHVDGGLTV